MSSLVSLVNTLCMCILMSLQDLSKAWRSDFGGSENGQALSLLLNHFLHGAGPTQKPKINAVSNPGDTLGATEFGFSKKNELLVGECFIHTP